MSDKKTYIPSKKELEDANVLLGILEKILKSGNIQFDSSVKQIYSPKAKEIVDQYNRLRFKINEILLLNKNTDIDLSVADKGTILINTEYNLNGLALDGIINLIQAVAEKNGLFIKIPELEKNKLIKNIFDQFGICDRESFDNMTSEQKGALSYNLGMLEERKLFFGNDKFISVIDSLEKIPNGQQKMFTDPVSVKYIIRNHPDWSLESKIKFLQKIKTTSVISENEAIIYLTDFEYQENKTFEIKKSGQKYFEILGGDGITPDQFVAATGNFHSTSGIGNSTSVCTGFYMYRSNYFKITDEIINRLNKDRNFIKEFQTLNISTAFSVTDEFFQFLKPDQGKLRNVLSSVKNKEYKSREAFEKLLNNLMPACSKNEESDKHSLLMFIDRNFLFKAFKDIKDIIYPTPASFEKELEVKFNGISDTLKGTLKKYSINSINSLSVIVPTDKDLELNITNYTNNENIINMSIGNIDMDFKPCSTGIAVEVRIDDSEINEVGDNLEEYGIKIPSNLLEGNIVFDRWKFNGQTLYIRIIDTSGNENQVHISSNSPLYINMYRIDMPARYEYNRFILDDAGLNLFVTENNINLLRIASLIKHADNIDKFNINTYNSQERHIRCVFDRISNLLTISSFATDNEIIENSFYNIPPIPPYTDIQMKTNPLLKILSELSEPDSDNLNILRSLNALKIIIDFYLKRSPASERVRIMKKDIIIKNLQTINMAKFFDVFNNIHYSRQTR